MRALLSASVGALALGGAGHHAHGPAGIPYLCGPKHREPVQHKPDKAE
jgi:hypothetical protein